MPTLESFNGASLVPDLVGAVRSGYQTGAGIAADQLQRKNEADAKVLRGSIMQGGPDAYAAWQKLGQLDPAAADEVTKMMQNRYMAADKQTQSQIDQNGEQSHIALLLAKNSPQAARDYISAQAQHNQDMGLPTDHYNQVLQMNDQDMLGTLQTHAAVYDAAMAAKRSRTGEMTAAERNLALYNAASPEDKATLDKMLHLTGTSEDDAKYLRTTKDGASVYDIRYPNKPATPIMGANGKPFSPQQGAVESRYMDSMLGNANEAAIALQNIIDMPDGGDSGIFGSGKIPNESILSSTKNTITNRLAPENVKSYNTMMAGVARQMAVVAGMGMQPNMTIVKKMDNLAFVDGDTQFDKARKTAEMRQIIEKALEVKLHNPRVPDEQKQFIQSTIDNLQTVVPYTQADLNHLRSKQDKDPSYTLEKLIAEKKADNTQKNPEQPAQSGGIGDGVEKQFKDKASGEIHTFVRQNGAWVRK